MDGAPSGANLKFIVQNLKFHLQLLQSGLVQVLQSQVVLVVLKQVQSGGIRLGHENSSFHGRYPNDWHVSLWDISWAVQIPSYCTAGLVGNQPPN